MFLKAQLRGLNIFNINAGFQIRLTILASEFITDPSIKHNLFNGWLHNHSLASRNFSKLFLSTLSNGASIRMVVSFLR